MLDIHVPFLYIGLYISIYSHFKVQQDIFIINKNDNNKSNNNDDEHPQSGLCISETKE